MYNNGHPGSFNPAVITNKEAHMIHGNINFTNCWLSQENKSKKACCVGQMQGPD